MESKIRFLTLNIGGRRDLAGLTSIISEYKLDIVFLQEVMLTNEELTNEVSKSGFMCNVNNADESSKPGTAIIWRSSLHVTDCFNIIAGRAQLAVFKDVILLNIYGPSGSNQKHERNQFFARDIFRIFNMYPSALWIFGGDFNAILNPLDVELGIGLDFHQEGCLINNNRLLMCWETQVELVFVQA